MDGREALGQDLAVAPVAAEDVIVHRQEERLAHGGGFLADREVGGALVDIRDVAVLPLPLDLVQHGLEFADEDHVVIEPQGVGRGECTRRQFVGEAAAVLVDGDAAQFDGLLSPDLGGGDDQLLDHGVRAPLSLGGSITEHCRAAIQRGARRGHSARDNRTDGDSGSRSSGRRSTRPDRRKPAGFRPEMPVRRGRGREVTPSPPRAAGSAYTEDPTSRSGPTSPEIPYGPVRRVPPVCRPRSPSGWPIRRCPCTGSRPRFRASRSCRSSGSR